MWSAPASLAARGSQQFCKKQKQSPREHTSTHKQTPERQTALRGNRLFPPNHYRLVHPPPPPPLIRADKPMAHGQIWTVCCMSTVIAIILTRRIYNDFPKLTGLRVPKVTILTHSHAFSLILTHSHSFSRILTHSHAFSLILTHSQRSTGQCTVEAENFVGQ